MRGSILFAAFRHGRKRFALSLKRMKIEREKKKRNFGRSVILKMSGRPLEKIRVLFTPPDFFINFGSTPIFQLFEALFWPKRWPKMLKFYPPQKLAIFWGRRLEDVRFYPMLNFGHFWPPSLVTLFTFKNVNNPKHLHTYTPQPENSKRAHLSVPALQTPPKFHEKTPRERRQNEISGGREQNKREILGSPPVRAPTKNKIGQMWSGQIRSTKIGQIRPNEDGQMQPVNFGQMWYWPNSVWPNVAK